MTIFKFIMEGPSFRWFLERVCYYAYGPQLTQRMRYMQLRFAYPPAPHSEGIVFCMVCAAPHYNHSACGVCRSAAGIPRSKEEHLPFFVRLARSLLALRFPHRSRHLFALYLTKYPGIEYERCKGCLTFCPKSLVTAERCITVCNSIVCCDAAWCLDERVLRCSLCDKGCCSDCVGTCPTCGRAAGCFKCQEKYQCELCADEEDTQYCVWHAPTRQPKFCEYEEKVLLLCARHANTLESTKVMRKQCAKCMKIPEWGFPTNEYGNVICSHDDDDDDGNEKRSRIKL
jgi:hypothetical protein